MSSIPFGCRGHDSHDEALKTNRGGVPENWRGNAIHNGKQSLNGVGFEGADNKPVPIDRTHPQDLLEPLEPTAVDDYRRGFLAGIVTVLDLCDEERPDVALAALRHLLRLDSRTLDEIGESLSVGKAAVSKYISRFSNDLGIPTEREEARDICAIRAHGVWGRKRRKKERAAACPTAAPIPDEPTDRAVVNESLSAGVSHVREILPGALADLLKDIPSKGDA